MSHPEGAVSIIGYAARLPGAETAEDVWTILSEGRTTVTEIPDARWSALRFVDPSGRAGTTVTRAAGVLEDPFAFDAGYFGISPREAEQMDPQQRILLQVTAQAFDHAGIDPGRIDRARTGVFVGAASSDHSTVGLQDVELVGPHYMLGNTLSILANRLSYQWDLGGPSYTVDTACSSSLFALEQALTAISQGRIDTAVVAGVNLLLSPLPFVGFAQAGMLSPDGICRAFGANGRGYVRAEGAVALILRRTGLARASGDRIRSEIVAAGTNNDGRTSGVALPSAVAQTRLLSDVLARGGYTADDLAFVEAHGTGTEVGDPAEAQALGEVYGARRAAPLPIGSAKTNFGHLEPASGLVGLLKAQLALEHGWVPVSLHAETPNPAIDFERLNLSLVRGEALAIPQRDRPWLAGVSSFGFGGANAHVVIRAAEPLSPASSAMPPALEITAASAESLRRLAATWRDRACAGASSLGEDVRSANARIARHRHRLVVPAEGPAPLAAALDAWLGGGDAASAVSGLTDAPVAFVFSGNGSQWPGMGRHLFETDPAFRDSVEETAACFRALGGTDAAAVFAGAEADLSRTSLGQPVLFALQLAVVDALAARGVRPAAVLGHSVGEAAAAVVSGRIARDAAARIVHVRSTLLEELRGTGAMAALETDPATAEDLMAETGGQLEIAAENGPESLTIAGAPEALARLLKAARAERIVGKRLEIDYPFHSAALDPIRDRLIDAVGTVETLSGDAAFFSSCRVDAAYRGPLDSAYWWDNARAPVRFATAVREMARAGLGLFLEISPRKVLQGYLRDSLAEEASDAQVLHTLDRSRAEARDAVRIAHEVLAAGGRVDRALLLGPEGPHRGELPAYPYETREHALWPAEGPDIFGRRARHPLLGARAVAGADHWTNALSLSAQPWLADHRIEGRPVLPAAAILEAFLAAARQTGSGEAFELRNLELARPVPLPESGPVHIRVGHDRAARRLALETDGAGGWSLAAQAWVLGAGGTVAGRAPVPVETVDVAGLYRALAEIGLDYGPDFARIEALGLQGRRAVARLRLPEDSDGFLADPRLVDAGLHAILALAAAADIPSDMLWLPRRIGRVRWLAGARPALAHVTLDRAGPEGLVAHARFYCDAGRLKLALDEVRLAPVARREEADPLLWDEIEVPAGRRPGLPAPESRKLSRAPTPPSDLQVIRDAIAGRLAWDIVADGASPAPDPRRDAALAALRVAGLAEDGPDGAPVLAETCPWPALDDLLSVLAVTQPGAQDLLKAAAAAPEGAEPPIQLADAPVRAAAARHLDGLTALVGRRVLCLGAPGAALLARLGRAAGHVTVAVPTGAPVERPVEAVRVASLDAALDGRPYDLVLGLSASLRFPPDAMRRVAALAAAGGRALLFEPAEDLFAAMTGLRPAPGDLERLAGSFAAAGLPLGATELPDDPGVTLLEGAADGVARTAAPCWTVTGDGALAEALRKMADAGAAPAARLLVLPEGPETALRAAAVLDTLRSIDPDSGPVWLVTDRAGDRALVTGLRRTAANETAHDVRAAVIDGPGAAEDFARRVAEGTPEVELVVAPDGTRSPRLVPVHLPEGAEAKRLEIGRRGALGSLAWRPVARQAPGPDEIEIEVEAAGLNFRDVMWAQGPLPPEALEDAFSGTTLGMECSGRVLRAGEDAGFRPGDRVIALAPAALASHVTVRAAHALAIPVGTDPVAAATIPVAFFTAEYALSELARLDAGETVLVHGAAGGVGMAATQIALARGATVIGTAGSPGKRRLVRALGAAEVFDSRGMGFEDAVREVTGGRGADVVLNSLSGEAMERSLACLAPFGRFVELGKRDFYANAALGMRVLRQNVTYHALDADQLLAHRPVAVRRVLERVVEGFRNEAYTALPHTLFAPEEAEEAFRTMQRSEHLGKVLIRPARPEVALPPPADLSGAWLVTGGTRGFGLEAACHLARRGADALWLVGRSGRLDAADRARIEAAGAAVHAVAADAADGTAMEALAARIAEAGGLAGVIHAAAIIDDAPLDDHDAARFERVLAPKLLGAEVLDRVTRRFDLRHFWLFSSIAARFGNPGQAAYVAANLELEALARRRRAEGRPALAVAWGPIADAGTLADRPDLREAIERRSGRLLRAREALLALDDVIASGRPAPTVTIAPVSWARLAADLPVIRGPLCELLNLDPDRAEPGDFDLAACVRAEGEAAARARVAAILAEEAGRILHAAPDEIDRGRRLTEMGFDSLMGVNLKLAVEERLGLDLPITAISEGPSIERIAKELVAAAVAAGGIRDAEDAMAERHLTEIELPESARDAVVAAVRRKRSA